MHRLGDSAVHTLGDTSAFVNPVGQLLLIAINSGLIAEWMASAYYLNIYSPSLKRGYIEFKYYADVIHPGLTPPG